jgi:hypothetical protein
MVHAVRYGFVDALKEHGSQAAKVISADFSDSRDADRILRLLIQFCAAGLRADPVYGPRKEVNDQ